MLQVHCLNCDFCDCSVQVQDLRKSAEIPCQTPQAKTPRAERHARDSLRMSGEGVFEPPRLSIP